VIIREDNKVTEGTTVAINFVSGSRKKIETMVLSKKSLNTNSRVLLVDDFLRGGGVMNGMQTLMNEFDAQIVGKVVLAECFDTRYDYDENYTYLAKLTKINEFTGEFEISEGNAINKILKGI